MVEEFKNSIQVYYIRYSCNNMFALLVRVNLVKLAVKIITEKWLLSWINTTLEQEQTPQQALAILEWDSYVY